MLDLKAHARYTPKSGVYLNYGAAVSEVKIRIGCTLSELADPIWCMQILQSNYSPCSLVSIDSYICREVLCPFLVLVSLRQSFGIIYTSNILNVDKGNDIFSSFVPQICHSRRNCGAGLCVGF